MEVSINCNDKVYNIGTTHLSYTHKFEETELKDKEVNKLIDTNPFNIPSKEKKFNPVGSVVITLSTLKISSEKLMLQ